MDIQKLGNATDDYVDLDFSGYVINENYLKAKILFVDEFGNIVTNIPGEELSRKITQGSILSIAGRQMPFLKTYGDVSKGKMLSLIGSHGFFEISVNQEALQNCCT
ncbi:MAG: SAM hydroxide adenosyltransferase [Methanolobus sp.]